VVSPNKIELIPSEIADIVPFVKYKIVSAKTAPKMEGINMTMGVKTLL